MKDEGVIKFRCDWHMAEAPSFDNASLFGQWRSRLMELGLLGVDSDGIGYGNMSVRQPDKKSFVITGTQTGHITEFDPAYCAEVTDWNIDENKIRCQGPLKASSESLTHGVLYDLSDDVKAVIHVHHDDLWQQLMDNVPTTRRDVPYGTPEMGFEVQRLFRENSDMRIFVMAGHDGGVVAFGTDLNAAGDLLIQRLQDLK